MNEFYERKISGQLIKLSNLKTYIFILFGNMGDKYFPYKIKNFI